MGPLMRLLMRPLRRRGLVLGAALLLRAQAGVVGRDAGDKLTSGAYLDPSAESQRAAELLTRDFPAGPPNLVLVAGVGEDRLVWHRIAALVMRRPVQVLVSVSARC